MIKAIVTDIEGTTSSLSFVKDVLFPYACEHMPGFVRSHANQPEVKPLLDDVQTLVDKSLDVDEIIQQLQDWIAQDQKITPLKTLQGIIWEAGYKAGDFSGHVYEDAVVKLREWHRQGIKLYVFSSGSVRAQQLIFGYSDFGDLSGLFSGYFDTRIGAKREIEAYRHIIKTIECLPDQILFLSDIEQELQAASAAGMQTLQLVREGQSAWPGTTQVSSFAEIDLRALHSQQVIPN